MKSQTKFQYADQKFNQGLATIRSRITVLNNQSNNQSSSKFNNLNNNTTNTLFANKTFQRTLTSSNTMQKLSVFIQQMDLIHQAVRQSIFQVKGLQNSSNIIKDGINLQITKQQNEMKQQVSLLNRNNKQRNYRINNNIDQLIKSSRQLKQKMNDMQGRMHEIQSCLGISKVNTKMI